MAFTSENNFTDRQLVNRILGGDTEAFAFIIKATERLVTQIIFKMISNKEDRKDILQDVYLKAFNNLKNFAFKAKLSTWIGQITYNACANYLEKKKLVLPGDFYHDDEDENTGNINAGETEIRISNKQLSAILTDEIRSLSPISKTLIVLYHQEDLSYHHIAQVTGLPEGTVKSYLFRARKALKENILAKYKKEEL